MTATRSATRSATRPAHSTLRRTIERTVAVAAFATIVGGGVVGGTAHAAELTINRPDLVGAGPTHVIANSHTTLHARVKNGGTGFASATSATISYQPVTRFTVRGKTYFSDNLGSIPITATGTVVRLSAGADAAFSARSDRTPSGLNRVTVCADSAGSVSELSESNNCFSEIKTVTAISFG